MWVHQMDPREPVSLRFAVSKIAAKSGRELVVGAGERVGSGRDDLHTVEALAKPVPAIDVGVANEGRGLVAGYSHTLSQRLVLLRQLRAVLHHAVAILIEPCDQRRHTGRRLRRATGRLRERDTAGG